MADPNRPVTGYPDPNHNGYPPPPPSYGSVPPPAYYNSNQYNNTAQNYYPDPSATQRATFLRRILRLMIAAVILTGTIVFIIWLILRPRFPDFRVDSFSVTNLNLSSSPSSFTGIFNVNFTVRNPNKKITLVYEGIDADIFYQTFFITENALPPFRQQTKNETALRGVFSALTAYVKSDAVGGIIKERDKGGNVAFNVRMLIRVGFNAGSWRVRERDLRVFCGDLLVRIASNASNGTMIGGPKQCRVGI